MKKDLVLPIVLPILFGILSYMASNSFIVMGVVFLTSLLYMFFVFYRRRTKYTIKYERFISCYQFIDNFIISLSVRQSIAGALENITSSMDKRFLLELNGLEHLSEKEKLTYLKKFYPFHIYELFLNIISIFEEQGGNIFELSSMLMIEARQEEEILHKYHSMSSKKLMEFFTLWAFSLLILIVMRFALYDMYLQMSSSVLFQVMIGVLFLFILLSIEFVSRKVFAIPIKGDDVYA